MMTSRSTPAAWLRPLAIAGLVATFAFGMTACKSSTSAPDATANGGDPAAANLAPADGSQPASGQPTQVMGTSASYAPQQQSQSYPQQQQPAPIEQNYNDQGYDDSQEAIEADQAPPPLPEYDQPAAPDPNYL